jgi:DNA segregation ATPase FtsK/SpoIIIE, S-DNA-T family
MARSDTKTRGRAKARRPQSRKPRRTQQERAERRDRLRDVWGVVLLVVAALAALGLWFDDAAGRVGVFLELAFRGLFGVFGLLAPVALSAVGVALLGGARPSNRRIAVGSVLAALGLVGLWHLAAGSPGFEAELAALHRSGGWLGAAVTRPLEALAATAGAAVLLSGVLVLGLLVATGTPPRTVVGWVLERLARMRGALREWSARRAEVRAQADEADGEDGAEVDEDAEALAVGHADTAALPDEPVAAEADEGEPSDTQLLPARLSAAGGGAATKLAPRQPDDAYDLPDLALLRVGQTATGNRKSQEQMTRALEHTLRQFGVDASVGRISRGPTVTRFELSLGTGTRVGAVTKLADDIAYAMATPEIRIVAPIPGKSAIGIEVPNRDRDLITLGDILRSPEASAHHHPLTAGLGKDIAGNPLLVNLATMPHLLIAGATGSGKSVTMNAIVTSILMRAAPVQARLILIDPKRVELNHYDDAPHLLTPVVTEPKRATEALDWIVKEMEQRYERLALLGYRNIDTYNQAVREGSVRQASALSGEADTVWEALPYILVVIDELADLMMVAPRDVENAIVRIAQMARAVGIHLIVATQRPSVDVVTGLIKANIPSRIALAMATQADSRTILDQKGAEKLVGDGDLLFMPANASKPHRIQGCFISETEIARVVGHCKAQRQPAYEPGVVKEGDEARSADVQGEGATDEDLTRAAMELVVRSGLGSTSMLQRKLKVGFARAGRLMDELEEMGVVGPSEGPKARQVLMSVEELEERVGGDAR